MKRFICLLLMLVLLSGCVSEPQPTTEVVLPTTAYVEPTEPAGSYLPGSEEELASGGALRSYPLPQGDVYALAMMGGDLLVFSGIENTTLTLLAGDNLYTVAQATLDLLVHPQEPAFRITENGITYYDGNDRSLVFLDQDLKEISRRETPGDMTGSPILSGSRTKLYYCTPNAVRVLDLETGIDRLLKETIQESRWLESILLEDTVLYYAVLNDGEEESCFISAETGELLYQRSGYTAVSTRGDTYYAQLMEGSLPHTLFGKAGETPQQLTPADPYANVVFAQGTHGAVAVMETAGGLQLQYFDLHSGENTAAVDLAGVYGPNTICADPETGYLYLLTLGKNSDGYHIYRWDPSMSPTGDETIYTHPRYTLENPDVSGLSLCADRAYSMSQAYGVQVLVGMNAVSDEPWDYELYPEHQVPVVNRMLDQLEEILGSFPEGFFQTLTEKTTHVPVKICLVRTMYGSPESGSLDIANGIQYWLEDDPYVAIAEGDMFAQTFYHEMFHVIESCVYGFSNAYDDWDQLNPKGFDYDYDYLTNLERDPEQYLDNKTRAFIDTYSMSYPKEDRARLLEYAVMEGNEIYFQSKTMQKKLETLCKGIREAFDLREYPNVLLWEQYLQKPLTPRN